MDKKRILWILIAFLIGFFLKFIVENIVCQNMCPLVEGEVKSITKYDNGNEIKNLYFSSFDGEEINYFLDAGAAKTYDQKKELLNTLNGADEQSGGNNLRKNTLDEIQMLLNESRKNMDKFPWTFPFTAEAAKKQGAEREERERLAEIAEAGDAEAVPSLDAPPGPTVTKTTLGGPVAKARAEGTVVDSGDVVTGYSSIHIADGQGNLVPHKVIDASGNTAPDPTRPTVQENIVDPVTAPPASEPLSGSLSGGVEVRAATAVEQAQAKADLLGGVNDDNYKADVSDSVAGNMNELITDRDKWRDANPRVSFYWRLDGRGGTKVRWDDLIKVVHRKLYNPKKAGDGAKRAGGVLKVQIQDNSDEISMFGTGGYGKIWQFNDNVTTENLYLIDPDSRARMLQNLATAMGSFY